MGVGPGRGHWVLVFKIVQNSTDTIFYTQKRIIHNIIWLHEWVFVISGCKSLYSFFTPTGERTSPVHRKRPPTTATSTSSVSSLAANLLKKDSVDKVMFI
jgi:hypothetical protein